eukprot:scaffold174166_cov18-Prasinocladus_malaysianus.AAC.1
MRACVSLWPLGLTCGSIKDLQNSAFCSLRCWAKFIQHASIAVYKESKALNVNKAFLTLKSNTIAFSIQVVPIPYIDVIWRICLQGSKNDSRSAEAEAWANIANGI